MNIYSRLDPTQILHIINRKREIQPGRVDLVDPNEYIQCAAMRHGKGMTFKPHRHKMQPIETVSRYPQESWVVISGTVKVTLYDLDDSVLHEDVLEPGDVSITLAGGHNYLFMAEDSIVYEFKTGPYLGQQADKVMI